MGDLPRRLHFCDFRIFIVHFSAINWKVLLASVGLPVHLRVWKREGRKPILKSVQMCPTSLVFESNDSMAYYFVIVWRQQIGMAISLGQGEGVIN